MTERRTEREREKKEREREERAEDKRWKEPYMIIHIQE
jgi:hypothetical protein